MSRSAAVADFVQGGVKLTPPPVKIGLNKFTIVINKLNLHWVNLQQMEILATYYQLLSKDVLHMYTCMQ